MLSLGDFFQNTCFSLTEVETALRKCDSIKYAAYRSAAKLRVIQKSLYLDKVNLRLISCVFERHHLQQTENSVQLDKKEMESVLFDIYFAVKRENDIKLDADYLSQLMINFLLKVYDKKMKGVIQVFSFKVGLTLLCQAKPREKYHYLFEQLADHNNCLSRKKLELFLKRMITVMECIGEGLSFGFDLVPGTVESCFQCNIGSLGISEDVFITWLMQDPQLLVWLSTLYRIQISESVTHNAKCGICKIYPLVGLRYRCLRCLSYDMCQSCFFAGKLTKKHKVKHPVQEFCRPMTSQQSTKAFLLTLRNRLYKKDSKLQYLPALRIDSKEGEALGQSTRFLDEMELSSRTVVNGSRVSLRGFSHRELYNIIVQLERESEKIIPQIDDFCSSADSSDGDEYRRHLKNCLLKHRAQVKAQVQKLKHFKNYLISAGKLDPKAFLASTPVADEILSKTKKRFLNRDLMNLSPISGRGCKSGEKQTSGKRIMWDNYDLVQPNLDVHSCDGASTSWMEIRNGVREEKVWKGRSESGEENRRDEESFWSWPDGNSDVRLTWLRETNEEKDEGKISQKNEETFQELQSDVKKILSKLHELSVVTFKEEDRDGASAAETKEEMNLATEVDTLLTDLISGIEKLIES